MKDQMNSRARLALAAAIALGAGGGLYATIPDATGVIHGCYTKLTGTLRVIDSAVSSCNRSEIAINWNVQGNPGLQGPAGPQGPLGPQGPAGPQGPPGNTNVLTDAVTVSVLGTGASDSLPVPGLGTVDLSCDASGRASVSITTTAPTFERSTTTSGGLLSPPGTLPTQPLGGTIWIADTSGQWKIDSLAADSISIPVAQPGFPTVLPCTAQAAVTVF